MSTFRLIFVVLFALFFASSAYAADIRLSSRCTLADAIIAANNDRAEGNCPAGRGADTIILSQDITLRAELPAITSKITIEGNGYTISGNNRYRIFYNDGGTLTINNLTMTEGKTKGVADAGGSAIFNGKDGKLNITNSNFSHNSALRGGAVFNGGELSISNSAFNRNSADRLGGAIANWGELSISDSSFNDNSADESGAIYNEGELYISDSSFSDNSADESGAIYNEGELSIVNSSFSNNSAEWGGAIRNWKDGELSISDSAFSGNSAERSGGAITNGEDGELSIVSSTFSNNSATDGLGGAVLNGGELSIVNSAFSDNSAEGSGGAIANAGELSIVSSTFSHNSAGAGGAIANLVNELSIVNSNFSGNSATDGLGGAVFNGGELSMVNSIIAGRGGDACFSIGRLKQNINNFIQDGSCSPAFRGDPRLGALVTPADGSPAYFPLLASSRAIDAADSRYCPETDQIGTKRPQGAGCDIGAIEYTAP